ncbi:MAG: hypothetical protein KGR24_06745 [Planctomycetes bacterium]|nr:hypothetical protein [Planctomycetota bacterium]
MHLAPRLTRISARLLAEGPADAVSPRRRDRYRLLVIGPALLIRTEPGPWRVPIGGTSSLLPTMATLHPTAVVHRPAVRVAATLLDPLDVAAAGKDLLTARRPRRTPSGNPEFYGWSLLYQLPGDGDSARVDAHEEFADLPAFYESALELADRQAFLGNRGIRTRVLALLTNRSDFDTVADGPPRNRYCSHAQWRRAGATAAFMM